MIDKRFWSGATIVATVVVAGASALPALLLGPSAPEPMVPQAAVAPIEKKAEPVVARVVPQLIVKTKEPTSAVQPVPPAVPAAPAPTPQAAMPQPPEARVPVVPPAVPARETAPVAFPPVQPVDVATSKGEFVPPIAVPPPMRQPPASITPDRPVAEKPARAQRSTAQRVAKNKRQVVRPAHYPIREFLAWRR